MGMNSINLPAAATAAVVTIAAAAGGVARHNINGIYWSYTAAPTGGNLLVESPSGTALLDVDITAAGPGSFLFTDGLQGAAGQAVIVTLASGAGAVVGSLAVNYRS